MRDATALTAFVMSVILLSILYLRCAPPARLPASTEAAAAGELSILYLRCRTCGLKTTAYTSSSFNSLFEMPGRVAVFEQGGAGVLSILYLRCGRSKRLVPTGRSMSETFNSLFEMRVLLQLIIHKQTRPFNSLFEMRT